MRGFCSFLALMLIAGAPAVARAQQANMYFQTATNPNGTPKFGPLSATNPLPVSGSFSATLAGFTPGLTYANLTATAASASVALPAGTVVQFQNTGTTAVSCTMGVGSATATANQLIVQAGSTRTVTVGSNTFGACIDQSGSVSNVVVLAGGAGLGNDSGGGGAGGGGGSVTQGTTPWIVAGQGTAGAAAAAVTTIQGIASMTPVQVSQATAASLNATVVGTGTFATQAAQSGTWTVQPGNTANTTPWLVTGSGTAGTAATGVVTIQGIAAMTKLLVTPDSVALPANQSVNVSQINAVTPLMGNGVTGTGSQRVTIASDNTAFTVNAAQSGTWNITNVSGTVSLPTGASTAANQTSVIGTVAAGTAATNALAIGGIYNSTPITMTNAQGAAHQLDVNGYLNVNVKAATGLAQASTTSGQTGSLVMGAVTTTAPAYTTAQTNPLSLTAQGALRVTLSQVGNTDIASGGTGGSQGVGGTTATNVAITDNPVNLGAQAVSSENTAVTTARKVQLVSDLVGKLIVLPYANPENFVSGVITTAMTGTTSTSLVAAPAAGLRNYLTSCTFSNEHATVGTSIVIQDGSGGTTLWTVPTAPAYGGAQITFPTPLRQPTTATAIFVANVTTGSSTKAACSGYKGA